MRSLGRAWLDQELPTFDAGHFIIVPQLGGSGSELVAQHASASAS